MQHRNKLAQELLEKLEGRVALGLFTGMRVTGEQPWDDGNLGPKLLGTYEACLRPWFKDALRRKPSRIINVGCAEGYYAVGLSLLAPDADTVVTDTSAACLRACTSNAKLNGIKMLAGGEITPGILSAMLPAASLLVMDCEGGEEKLLDPDLCPALAQSDVIVECHDFMYRRDISETIRSRLLPTHDVYVVHDAHLPSHAFTEAMQHPALSDFADTDKLTLVNEMRPDGAIWIYALRR